MDGSSDGLRQKRVGWLCSYVPEEIIIAAGLEPVRITGDVEKVKEADAYIYPNFCPYLKNILESGLRSNLEHVEGIIFTNSCDGMRRLYDVWSHYVQLPFTYMLELPKNREEAGIKYFSDQLLCLKRRLEEVFEVNISEDELEKAISLMNDHRRMMIALFERQKDALPLHKGTELLALCLEEMTNPKDVTTGRLKNLTEKFRNHGSSGNKHPRILIIGNVINRPILFKIVETAGASVVAIDTCTGLRHYSGPVEKNKDPIESLARRYLLKPPCARMPGFDKRTERVEQLIHEYSIDGIIYSIVKFCDYGLFDAPVIEGSFGDRRMPFLTLENDYSWADEGRIRTRVEAFVEMIRGEFE